MTRTEKFVQTSKTMKPKLHLLVASLLLATTSSALATVRYVNVNNANAVGPAPVF